MSFVHVDHTINSASGRQPYILVFSQNFFSLVDISVGKVQCMLAVLDSGLLQVVIPRVQDSSSG